MSTLTVSFILVVGMCVVKEKSENNAFIENLIGNENFIRYDDLFGKLK